MKLTRRRLLASTAAAASTGAFAGCIGDGASSESETVQASFFVFGDIAEHVAGEATSTNLLVPVGQHGHGWEPGPSVREDINSAELLLHGTEGFQPWVDDMLTDIDVDAPDLDAVDVSSGLDLIEAGEAHNASEHEEEEHHSEEGHHSEEEHHSEDEHHDEHEEDQEHDHGSVDPHFWMDPLRVKAAAETVREGFVDVDPDNAEAYTENTQAYHDELDSLHEKFEALVADASQDVLLIAGHDSFQYFGDQYGITIEALTNVSPDDRPTARDIDRAQEVIETHGLQYICADPLESQQAAEQLVAETDAREVLPLTAMPGLTEEWEREDWGYVGVMENVNLPTLERALEA